MGRLSLWVALVPLLHFAASRKLHGFDRSELPRGFSLAILYRGRSGDGIKQPSHFVCAFLYSIAVQYITYLTTDALTS